MTVMGPGTAAAAVSPTGTVAADSTTTAAGAVSATGAAGAVSTTTAAGAVSTTGAARHGAGTNSVSAGSRARVTRSPAAGVAAAWPARVNSRSVTSAPPGRRRSMRTESPW